MVTRFVYKYLGRDRVKECSFKDSPDGGRTSMYPTREVIFESVGDAIKPVQIVEITYQVDSFLSSVSEFNSSEIVFQVHREKVMYFSKDKQSKMTYYAVITHNGRLDFVQLFPPRIEYYLPDGQLIEPGHVPNRDTQM